MSGSTPERAEQGRGAPTLDSPGALDGAVELDDGRAMRLLRDGELEVVGRLTTASNITLLCRIALQDPATGQRLEADCVYKPLRGEAPLWDFPDGTLAHREVAAFAVSETSGWAIVPPTVFRDGPYGPGMVQLWIEKDAAIDVVECIRSAVPVLRPVALFDAVVNNADRKAGHLLPVPGGRIVGVDHGVCFSPDPKLRTVLWGWRGTRIRSDELDALRRLRRELDGPLGGELGRLLAADEVAATAARIEALLASRRFPVPDPERPATPWPWY